MSEHHLRPQQVSSDEDDEEETTRHRSKGDADGQESIRHRSKDDNDHEELITHRSKDINDHESSKHSYRSENKRSILNQLAEKFSHLRHSNHKLPLGMTSGTTKTPDLIPCEPRTLFTEGQTPTRAQELTLIRNLTLSDDNAQQVGESQEPVICWHPYARAHAGNQGAHHCLPCGSSFTSVSSESDSSSDSLMIDPNLILDSNVTMAIAKEGTNLMAVKAATVCHNNPEEDYKMTSRPRGPCLIVNNIDFQADWLPTRKGSDEDARRFDDIFKQLGFTVIMRRNQTADEMRKLFKDVASQCKREHDALFVFIFSHGSEHGIYGIDGLEVCLESEIISCFDNRNCKAMLGKPKVFAIQACRGSK